MTIDPVRQFMVQGQVATLQSAALAASIANNQAIVAAVTGQIIRVMGWDAQSNTATQGSFIFKSASGGTAISMLYWAPPSTGAPLFKVIADSGYYETATGQGLFTDVAAGAVNLNIYYITYTP